MDRRTCSPAPPGWRERIGGVWDFGCEDGARLWTHGLARTIARWDTREEGKEIIRGARSKDARAGTSEGEPGWWGGQLGGRGDHRGPSGDARADCGLQAGGTVLDVRVRPCASAHQAGDLRELGRRRMEALKKKQLIDAWGSDNVPRVECVSKGTPWGTTSRSAVSAALRRRFCANGGW